MHKLLYKWMVVGMLGWSSLVQAVSPEFLELLSMLRDNGTITREQHRQLLRAARPAASTPSGAGEKRPETVQRAGPKTGRENAVAAQPEEPDGGLDVKVSTEGGVEVNSSDGQFSFKLGGRLMTDAAYYQQDKNRLGSGTELRRARIELEGTLYEHWGYELGVDFGDGSSDVKDAYAQYSGFAPATLRIGQFKEPFSLEELTSSKYITFMERSLPNEFAPGRKIGFGAHTHGRTWTAAAGVFGEGYDDDADNEGDEGWGITGRLTYAPLHEKRQALHLGASASLRRPDDNNTVRFRSRPESHVTNVRFVNTGTIENVDNIFRYGLEAAWVQGPFSLQGEYVYTDVQRDSGADDLDFDGWYAFGSWFLTGESRPFKLKKGAFGGVKPRTSFGAWELALRYSTLDLDDKPVTGGKEDNITLGLNWYVNPQLRFMANYIWVNNNSNANDDGKVEGDDDPRIFQMRAQTQF